MEDGKVKNIYLRLEREFDFSEPPGLGNAILRAIRQARKEALLEAADIAECKIYVTDDCNEICRMIAAAIRTAGEREI